MKRVTRGACLFLSLGAMALAQTNEVAPQAPVLAAAGPKSWTDSLTARGDVRLRFEQIGDDSKKDSDGDTYTRSRARLRARLGVDARCSDQLKAGLELSTGAEDPVSGNQSMDDGFGKKEMRLSLAYLDYTLLKSAERQANVVAGKMKNPFLTQPDDLVWDSDVTPEGVAAKLRLGQGFASLNLNAGCFVVDERSSQTDAMLAAAQGALKLQFSPDVALTAGAAYYNYSGVQGYDVIDWEDGDNAYGNSTVDGTVDGETTHKAWAAGFTPVVAFAQLGAKVFGLPVSLHAQALTNPDADDNDQGHMAGVSLGQARQPRSFEVGYSYAKLEQDATLGMFTDSDRWGGGTDGKGHKFAAKYQIAKGLQAGITYFLNDRKIADAAKTTDYDRLQIDLAASF